MLIDELDAGVPNVATTEVVTSPTFAIDVELIPTTSALIVDTQDSVVGSFSNLLLR